MTLWLMTPGRWLDACLRKFGIALPPPSPSPACGGGMECGHTRRSPSLARGGGLGWGEEMAWGPLSRARRLLLAASMAAAVLSGCSSAPAPADRYYRLVDVPASDVVAQQWTNGTIEIQELRAHGLYLERPIVFTDVARPARLEQYNYHHWIYAPAYLIQQHMVQRFRASHLAGTITDDDDGPAPSFVISGRIVRFEERLAPAGPSAEAELELEVTRPGQAAPLFSKTYSATQAAASDSMDAFAVAMGQALEQIYVAFSKDLMAIKAAQ